MFTGINFMPSNAVLTGNKLEMFRYFTVDSNILMGIASLILLIYEYKYIFKKQFIPKNVHILKFIGTTSVALTFITTLVFFTPTYGFYALYSNSNLIFHLIVPLLAIISFVFLEKYKSRFSDSFLGIVPMFIYAVFYITNIIYNLNNGGLTYKYDFYGFFFGDVKNIYIVFPIILLVTYLMGLIMLFLNKKLNK